MTNMFKSGKIANLELKNRIVRSATWEAKADESGKVTDSLIEMNVALAENEVGLVILGHTAVAPEGKGMVGMSGLFSDSQIDGNKKLTEKIHEVGGKISIQLAHVGGQVDGIPGSQAVPVSPSGIKNPAFKTTPKELTNDEIKKLIEDYGKAAQRAVKAGFDAIQLHGAHGYMISQFISPFFNKRNDEFGDPHKFVLDVFKSVKANAGTLPVLIKQNIDDFLEGSITPEISLPISKALSDAGIDAIEVSAGTPASGKLNPSRMGIKSADQEAFLLDLAKKVKEIVTCPVISVGGYRSPDVINKALEEIDFVSISRPFIREPDLIKRWKQGDTKPAKCVSCNRCFATVQYGEGIQCMIEYKARMKQEESG